MAKLPDASVQMILTDLPYGTTSNSWDSVIPLDLLWAEWKRVCVSGAPIVLFTQQPFTTTVAASNLKQLKTEWIWEKAQGTGFLNANKYPLKNHENILVFCDQTPTYNPQKSFGALPYTTGRGRSSTNYRKFDKETQTVNTDGSRYPKTVLKFNSDKGYHPTQKPVALLEYLIKTYSNVGDTILDCTMGSGSTGVAAINTDRQFIGIEKEESYFNIAKKRIQTAQDEQSQTLFNLNTLLPIPTQPDIPIDIPA
jgi:site-specific DNA-methyltransferase (adenine-specific)